MTKSKFFISLAVFAAITQSCGKDDKDDKSPTRQPDNQQVLLTEAANLTGEFSGIAGGFILAAPTAAGMADANKYGLWFPAEALKLPDLAGTSLVYEGWLVDTNQTPAAALSTGRFDNPNMRDSDGAGPAKGPGGDGPAFPGQDYVNPPQDLTAGGFKAVITIELRQGDDPAPSSYKILVGDIPAGSTTGPDNLLKLAATKSGN